VSRCKPDHSIKSSLKQHSTDMDQYTGLQVSEDNILFVPRSLTASISRRAFCSLVGPYLVERSDTRTVQVFAPYMYVILFASLCVTVTARALVAVLCYLCASRCLYYYYVLSRVLVTWRGSSEYGWSPSAPDP